MSDQDRHEVSAATVKIDRESLRELVNLAQGNLIEHRYEEVKITDRCGWDDDDCDSPKHPNCGQWGTKHDPTKCAACVPIRVARQALGDVL